MTDSGGRANRPGEPIRPRRKPLGHEVPQWVKSGAVYFITICAKNRANQPLLLRGAGRSLIDSAVYLHKLRKWHLRLFLVMPDHVHALVSFPAEDGMKSVVSGWKGYTAKNYEIKWQDRFFEHRIRSDESLDERIHYIRMNPVRAGLIQDNETWPYIFQFNQ